MYGPQAAPSEAGFAQKGNLIKNNAIDLTGTDACRACNGLVL